MKSLQQWSSLFSTELKFDVEVNPSRFFFYAPVLMLGLIFLLIIAYIYLFFNLLFGSLLLIVAFCWLLLTLIQAQKSRFSAARAYHIQLNASGEILLWRSLPGKKGPSHKILPCSYRNYLGWHLQLEPLQVSSSKIAKKVFIPCTALTDPGKRHLGRVLLSLQQHKLKNHSDSK
jgi:hypothetical protein